MTTGPLWMRHGTCDDGLCRPGAHARPDSPLTIAGAVETQLTVRRIYDHGWRPGLVSSSPLPRARQSAAIAADSLGVQLDPAADAFAEWRAPTCVLGRTATQYPPEYVRWREQRDHEPDIALPGGETLRAFAHRAAEAGTAARDLAAEHGTVLIVSHRLLIGAIAALHAGHHHPADIFGYACRFRLLPAQPWTPASHDDR